MPSGEVFLEVDLMRWEDERYVRLYTRDTVTWKLLPWQGKALLPLLLRKLDRAGVLDLADEDAPDAISALTELPIDVVRVGWPALVERGVFAVSDTQIVAPKFIEAQETPQSDRQRKAESRARARNMASQPAEIITDESALVTRSHTESHGVTPGHSVLCRAVPDCAVPIRAVPKKLAPASQPPLALELSPTELPEVSATRRLTDSLCAIFAEQRGVKYAFSGRDGKAARDLMAMPGIDQVEIERRWRDGLNRQGFAQVSTLWQLVAKWNDITAPQRDPRKGGARAEDVDWSKFNGRTGDVTNEF